MKKSIVGQIRRSFFSHDQKSADHATFDETIKFENSENIRKPPGCEPLKVYRAGGDLRKMYRD